MLDIDRFHAKSALVGGDIGRGQRAKARAAEADLEADLLHEEVIAVVVEAAAIAAAVEAVVVVEVTVAAEEAAAIAVVDDVKLFTTSQPTASMAHPRRQSGQLKLTTYHHGAAGKI